MGDWEGEASAQIRQFQTERLETRNALQLIAYWANETGFERNFAQWAPILVKVLRDAPPEAKGLFERLVLANPVISNPLSRAFMESVTRKVFDVQRPSVTRDVKAELFDYIRKQAKFLDRSAPDRTVPRFNKKQMQAKVGTLFAAAVRGLGKKRKKPSPKNQALALIVLAAILLWNPK